MASTFDDTVLDFDLNLLQQPIQSTVVNDCKYDKQRKAIHIAKKKTIATDSLIRKYYAKNEKLEQTEVLLLAAKEECKQVCIDYKETLEKCTQVEKNAVALRIKNKELEDSNILLQNQCEAIKSHANQLQVLVNEHETTIEALKIEKQLNKNNNKDYETRLTHLKNDNETILKHLCLIRDIVFGKRKLKKHHKLLLKKYDTYNFESDAEESSEESNEEHIFCDSLPPSPVSVNDTENKKEINFNVNRNSNLVKKVIDDHESDCSNEVVSEDTGRGSSLAFSDGEKCFNSPDYFQNDSPFATDITKPKYKKIFADSGTSPVYQEFVHVATSPIIFDHNECWHNISKRDKAVQVESESKKIHIISDVIIKPKNNLVDSATSPIPDISMPTCPAILKNSDKDPDNYINTLHSIVEVIQPEVMPAKCPLPCKESEHSSICDVSMTEVPQVVSNNEQDIRKSNLSGTVKGNSINTSEPKQIYIQDLSSQCEIEFSGKSSSKEEKKCLERNNSNNVCHDTVNDGEIEMILNTMRLTERLITPIPKTPVKLTKKKSRLLFSPVPEVCEPLQNHTACTEALMLKEENKTLKTSISDLSKEIMKIKRILKDQMLMPESPKKQVNIKNTTINSDLTEDSSQETIVISVNNDVNSSDDLSDDLPLSEYKWPETSPPKQTKKQHSVKTDIKVSPKKHSRSDNINCHMLQDTNESRNKLHSYSPRKTSRTNSHEEHVIVNNNQGIIAQDQSKEFSDTEIEDEGKRNRKMNCSKLSRLEKFRKKLLPKCKIARIKAPITKLRRKPKSIPASLADRLINKNNLNNKSAYENAVNVMKELKLKQINKQSDVLKLKKQKVCESVKKGCEAIEALNKDLIITTQCSPRREGLVKMPQFSPNKMDSVKPQLSPNKKEIAENVQSSLNKEDLAYIGQLSVNNEICVKIAQFLPSTGDLVKVTQSSSNKNDLIKIAYCTPNNEDLTNMVQCSPNKNCPVKTSQLSPNSDSAKILKSPSIKDNSVKISQLSPNKADLVKTAQLSPIKYDPLKVTPFSPSKEDSGNSVKQPVVCLSQLQLNTITNKSSRIENNSETGQDVLTIVNSPPSSIVTKNYITTRSRSKMSDQESIASSRKSSTESMTKCTEEVLNSIEGTPPRKRSRRTDSEGSIEVTCKRVLRSSNMRDMFKDHNQLQNTSCNISPESINKIPQKRKSIENENSLKTSPRKDLSNLFGKSNEPFSQYDINTELSDARFDDTLTASEPANHPKQSILCKMIDKYGKANIRFNAKKVPDSISNSICKKLEDNIAHITELPPDKAKPAMAKLLEDIQHNWNVKNFLSGFLRYLKDPARKVELFNKVTSPPAPAMTKSEQVLLYIVKQLATSVPDVVNIILTQIEFSLFQLNKTPEFDVIESLSHVYALICRYFGLKMRLRLFILDAMYCLSFKVVPLIKQCLDVWMHILPLAHMGIAKTPLVTCLVYLLHFYKCEDRYNRVQDIRVILNKKYFYQITDWNEPKILELFRTSISEIRDISVEKKMLRMALIILAKRQGPDWCQKNIIKKMLMPLIENDGIHLRVKQFSIEMLGPLLKPYPVDMKVHCEIVVNNLLDMLDLNPPDALKEAIFTSLIYMSKHNQNRVLQALLSWKPKQISPEFEQLLKDYVQEKSLKVWKGLLSRITF